MAGSLARGCPCGRVAGTAPAVVFGLGQLVLSQAMPGHSWELAQARDHSQLTV